MPLILPHGFLGRQGGLGTMPAVRFPGSTGMTRSAPASGFTDNPRFALSFWIKFNGGDGSDQEVFMCHRSSGAVRGVDLWRTEHNDYHQEYESTGGTTIATQDFLAPGDADINVALGWHHVISIRDNTQNAYRAYINGTLVRSDTGSSTNLDQVGAAWAFAESHTGSIRLNADVADFRYWSDNIPNFLSASVREQVISDGLPVFPAPDGAVDGQVPKFYFSAANGAWNVNLGSIPGNWTFTGIGSVSYVDSGLSYVAP